MTEEEKWQALSALLLLTEKRDKSIKARACADGRKQHQWTSKDDSACPTVSTQAIFMIGTTDAHKGHDVATMDSPGAFFHADVDENVTMVMEGRLAEIMVITALQICSKYITVNSKRKEVLFIRTQKAP